MYIYCMYMYIQVHCQGQVIGAVLAQSQAVAQHSARLVRVHYEELQCIITIEVSRTKIVYVCIRSPGNCKVNTCY